MFCRISMSYFFIKLAMQGGKSPQNWGARGVPFMGNSPETA